MRAIVFPESPGIGNSSKCRVRVFTKNDSGFSVAPFFRLGGAARHSVLQVSIATRPIQRMVPGKTFEVTAVTLTFFLILLAREEIDIRAELDVLPARLYVKAATLLVALVLALCASGLRTRLVDVVDTRASAAIDSGDLGIRYGRRGRAGGLRVRGLGRGARGL